MGQNKALLLYQGFPMVEHMTELLCQAGCNDVYISGEVPGYDGIPDAVRHDGPACAMAGLLASSKDRYERILFVPVDMPLIQIKSLQRLLGQNNSVYYQGYNLPACIRTGKFDLSCSVRELLALAGAQALDLPPEEKSGMMNINTKKEWEELAS